MSDRDEAIGRNLARLRGDKPQQEVADAMRAAGYKWSQATVWAVEKGDRPLRLAEAESLAEVLGTRIDNFMRTESFVKLEIAMRRVKEAHDQLRDDIAELYERQIFLAATAGEVELSELMRAAVEDWLRTTPEQVAALARATREGAAAAKRIERAAALGLESVDEFDSSEHGGFEHATSYVNNPLLRILKRAYSGEHSEEG